MSTNRIRKVPWKLFFILSISLAGPAAHASEYQEQMAKGKHLTAQHDYREALKAYQAAYAIQQDSSLLIQMARLHMQLGEGREALDTYRRFLVAVPDADSALRQEAEQQIARLRALLEPPPPPSMQLPSPAAPITAMSTPPFTPEQFATYLSVASEHSERARIKRRNTGLMVGGSVMFGVSYLAAFLSGTLLFGDNYHCSTYTYSGQSGYYTDNNNCKIATGFLLVPGIGPIISGLVTPSVYWSIPWIFVDGAAQLGGLAMMIIAAHSNHTLSKKTGIANLSILPHTSATSSGIAIAGRF